MRRVVVIILISLLLGPATLLLLSAGALFMVDGSSRHGGDLYTRNGHEVWTISTHGDFALDWVNCELIAPAPVTPVPDGGSIPEWATPPQTPWPEGTEVRVATLAVGWPRPWLTRQWTAYYESQIFPLRVVLDTSGESLVHASGRFWESDPAAPRRILIAGLLIDAGLFIAMWLAALTLLTALFAGLRRMQSRRMRAAKVTPPAGAAGSP